MNINENALSSFVDWFELYLKNRDIILKKLISIEKDKNSIKAVFKDKVQNFNLYLNSNNLDIDLLKKEENPSLVFLNTEENFSYLLNNWNNFISIPKLSIYFINPFSENDKRWIIFPNTHHQVSESDSLEKGLRTLFESVDIIDEKTYVSKL